MRFLKQFQTVIVDEPALDALIIKSEKDLKTQARAKLTYKELYRYDGNSLNMERLSYRFGNVKRIIRDIFEGVDRNA